MKKSIWSNPNRTVGDTETFLIKAWSATKKWSKKPMNRRTDEQRNRRSEGRENRWTESLMIDQPRTILFRLDISLFVCSSVPTWTANSQIGHSVHRFIAIQVFYTISSASGFMILIDNWRLKIENWILCLNLSLKLNQPLKTNWLLMTNSWQHKNSSSSSLNLLPSLTKRIYSNTNS